MRELKQAWRPLAIAMVAFAAACCGSGQDATLRRSMFATTTATAATATSSTTAARAGTTLTTTARRGRRPVPGTPTTTRGATRTSAPIAVRTTAPPAGGCAGHAGAQHDISYGPSTLDIYPTAGCAAGVVVFVHGGGYCCGDKASDVGAVVPWFVAQGWAFVSVDYRLGVPYPTFDDDVADALRWVHANATSFGADGSNVVLLGHSTGAEMVAEIGTTPSLLAQTGGVRCVGALDGSAYDIGRTIANANPSGRRVYRAAYGTSPAGWTDASAISYATAGHPIPPFLVAERNGEGGTRLAQQQAFVAALRRAGVPVTVVDASSLGHLQVLTNIGAPGDTVMTPAVRSFLAGC